MKQSLNPDGTVRGGGGGAVSASGYNWQYLHQGGRYDEVSGLYSFRHRDYSPTLQRWLQQDPMGYVDGASLYGYITNNPISDSDPLGLQVRSSRTARQGRQQRGQTGGTRSIDPRDWESREAFERAWQEWESSYKRMQRPAPIRWGEPTWTGPEWKPAPGSPEYKEAQRNSRPSPILVPPQLIPSPPKFLPPNGQKDCPGANQPLSRFRNPRLLNRHFGDHGGDFGSKTAEEYERQANDFINNTNPFYAWRRQMKTRSDGDMVFYDPVTEEFAVTAPDGTLRTYYKPNPQIHGYPTNQDYFNAQ